MAFDLDVTRRLGSNILRIGLQRSRGISALSGPSGAGKSSLLHMIAGLMRPDQGHIIVDGVTMFDNVAKVDLPPARRQCGYIFQDARLFPHMSVRANLTYGCRRPDRVLVDEGLDLDATVQLLGIGHLLDRHPATLSGGEAQRVAIGRALLSRPRFFLMDEPLTGIDRPRRQEILALIAETHARTAIPILYVSHDREELAYLTDDIVHMPDLQAS